MLRPNLRDATALESQAAAQQVAASTLALFDKGYNVSFNSLANQFSWNTSCSVTVQSVNVVYDLVSKAANYTLSIGLNPSLTAVTVVTVYPAQVASGSICLTSSGCNHVNWVGPEYYDSAGIAGSGATWSVPSIVGSGGAQCTCQFIEWTGLASQAYGHGGDAQAGTTSGCYAPCSSYYYAYWYDFPTTNLFPCTNDPSLSGGASVGTDVYPGSGYTYYFADVYDYTHSVGCDGQSPQNYMGKAFYVEFMGEQNYGPIPQFSTLTFSGADYCDTGCSTYVYITNSWTTAYIIDKTTSHSYCGLSENYNVCPSGVSSGSFSLTWATSAGT
jgi:hypothetical protein